MGSTSAVIMMNSQIPRFSVLVASFALDERQRDTEGLWGPSDGSGFKIEVENSLLQV